MQRITKAVKFGTFSINFQENRLTFSKKINSYENWSFSNLVKIQIKARGEAFERIPEICIIFHNLMFKLKMTSLAIHRAKKVKKKCM